MSIELTPQKQAHENLYGDKTKRFGHHISTNAYVRYLRDRRLLKALSILRKHHGSNVLSDRILTICGGAGGEGIFFLNQGFTDVTVSDFSKNALTIASELNGGLKTLELDAEKMDLPNESYDIVVVHDGLHHLPRPATGFTEMLRVAKKAVIVIEPYNGFVGRLLGTEWETTEDVVNYVYRWDRRMIEQNTKSFLLEKFRKMIILRLWDHSGMVGKLADFAPARFRSLVAKSIYGVLNLFNFAGNNMIAIVFK